MYWSKDRRYVAGGFWRCAVTHRAKVAARVNDPVVRERKNAAIRARYDSDPVYRIEKRLKDDARVRAQRLKRRRERLRGEV